MMRYILLCFIALISFPMPIFAQNIEEQYYLWVEGRQNEIKCFEPNSAFQYCVNHDPNKGYMVVDKNGVEIYQIYYFDNGPDYAKEGLYRVRKGGKIGYANQITGEIVIDILYDCAYSFENGQARVGFGCSTETDGEHSWWVDGEWQVINNPLEYKYLH